MGFDFCYFIPSVPAKIAQAYLRRTFGWSFRPKNNCSVHLFIRYYDGSPPPSYLQLQQKFPTCCCLQQNLTVGSRIVIAADLVDFFDIYSFISTLPGKQLFEELNKAISPHDSALFRIGDSHWNTEKPRIMGILNVTPDSFYDGGKFYHLADYTDLVEKMIQAGAEIIDIGGESSRPGAKAVSEAEEIERVAPAIRQIRSRFNIPISGDTVKPKVAQAMLEMGADMINDISGLSAGKKMIKVVKKYQAGYCLMHAQGQPGKMQDNPQYFDPVAEIYQFFKTRLQICKEEGLSNDRILLDPGIGFGKTILHNLDILRFLSAFSKLNCLILIGTSNKSFIGYILKREIEERLAGTITTTALSWMTGATVFRVHSVAAAKDAVTMARLFTHDL